MAGLDRQPAAAKAKGWATEVAAARATLVESGFDQSLIDNLDKQKEELTAKHRAAQTPEFRRQVISTQMAKASKNIEQYVKEVDTLDKTIADIVKKRDEFKQKVEQENATLKDLNAELASLDIAEESVIPEDLKGNPELEAMEKTIKEAQATLKAATITFQQKLKDMAAQTGGDAPKAADEKPGEAPMDVDPPSAEEKKAFLEKMAKLAGIDLSKMDGTKRKELEKEVDGFSAPKKQRK